MLLCMESSDADDDLFSRQYPSAEMTADEFERFVVATLKQSETHVDNLRVTLHDVIEGTDGVYDFDATVRYTLAGLEFLVVVEAKRHSHPIKRDVLQSLYSKTQSVGAHKAVVVSTAPFQSGALKFALAHGIALVKVTEGRFTYETKGAIPHHALTRSEAAKHFGLPTYVAHCYSKGSGEDSVVITVVTDRPEYAAGLLLGAGGPIGQS